MHLILWQYSLVCHAPSNINQITLCRSSNQGSPNLTSQQTPCQRAVAKTGRTGGPAQQLIPTLLSSNMLATRAPISSAMTAARMCIEVGVKRVRPTRLGSSHASQEPSQVAHSPGSQAGHKRAGDLISIWDPWMTGTAPDLVVCGLVCNQGGDSMTLPLGLRV